MRIIYTFLFAAFIFSAQHALAEDSPFKGGMKQSTLYLNNKNTASPEEDLEIVEKRKKNRVWRKYQALAAGEKEAEEKSQPKDKHAAKEIAPIKTVQPQAVEPQKTNPNAMGILLQQYQKNKEQRKNLKSLSFATPSDLEPRSKGITQSEDKE